DAVDLHSFSRNPLHVTSFLLVPSAKSVCRSAPRTLRQATSAWVGAKKTTKAASKKLQAAAFRLNSGVARTPTARRWPAEVSETRKRLEDAASECTRASIDVGQDGTR